MEFELVIHVHAIIIKLCVYYVCYYICIVLFVQYDFELIITLLQLAGVVVISSTFSL